MTRITLLAFQAVSGTRKIVWRYLPHFCSGKARTIKLPSLADVCLHEHEKKLPAKKRLCMRQGRQVRFFETLSFGIAQSDSGLLRSG